jgi:hypothetical protein
MADIEQMTITIGTEAMVAFSARMAPLLSRLAELIEASDPHGPVAGLEMHFSDLFDGLATAGLLFEVKRDGLSGLRFNGQPSAVFERLADLMAAVGDAIEAKLQAGESA